MTTQNDMVKAETQAIAKPRVALPFVPTNLDEAWRQAEMLGKASLLPDALRQKPHDILVVLMTGAELGLSPMQSIREVYVVKGKGYISALLKVSLVRQSGLCLSWQMIESTDAIATFETQRKGDAKPTRMSFTAEQAKRAELLGRPKRDDAKGEDNWTKYTALMLRRRCTSQLADEVYPDVLRGTGAEDEMPDELEVTGARIDGQAVYAPPPPPPASVTVESPKVESAPIAEKAAEPGAPDPVEVLIADMRDADSLEALAALAIRAKAVLGEKHPRRAEAMALYADRKAAVTKAVAA